MRSEAIVKMKSKLTMVTFQVLAYEHQRDFLLLYVTETMNTAIFAVVYKQALVILV